MADEIHALNKNEIQDIDYDTYFGEMDLSDEEKEDRKNLCYVICLVIQQERNRDNHYH